MYYKHRTDFDKKNIECRMVGNYPSLDDKTYRELSYELKYHAERHRQISLKLREIDFETPKFNKRSQFGNYEGGIRPQYSNIVRDEETKEIKSFKIDSVSICGQADSHGDVLTEEAKESIKKQFAEMFPLDIDFKITSSPPEDRVINQNKKPVPPKPREQSSLNKTNSTIKGR